MELLILKNSSMVLSNMKTTSATFMITLYGTTNMKTTPATDHEHALFLSLPNMNNISHWSWSDPSSFVIKFLSTEHDEIILYFLLNLCADGFI